MAQLRPQSGVCEHVKVHVPRNTWCRNPASHYYDVTGTDRRVMRSVARFPADADKTLGRPNRKLIPVFDRIPTRH